MTDSAIALISTEEWREVPGYEGVYSVSSMGRFRCEARVLNDSSGRKRRAKAQMMLGWESPDGYLRVSLWRDNRRKTLTIHCIVALAFLGPRPEGLQVRHLDGDKKNNALKNLAYGTTADQVADRKRHGTFLFGERANGAKLDEAAVQWIRDNHHEIGRTAMARLLGVSIGTVSDVVRGKSWRHVEAA